MWFIYIFIFIKKKKKSLLLLLLGFLLISGSLFVVTLYCERPGSGPEGRRGRNNADDHAGKSGKFSEGVTVGGWYHCGRRKLAGSRRFLRETGNVSEIKFNVIDFSNRTTVSVCSSFLRILPPYLFFSKYRVTLYFRYVIFRCSDSVMFRYCEWSTFFRFFYRFPL